MTTINGDKLPSVQICGTAYRSVLSDDRFVEVVYDDAQKKWGIKAGQGDASISMGLSDEAMSALLGCYKKHRSEHLTYALRLAVTDVAEWKVVEHELTPTPGHKEV